MSDVEKANIALSLVFILEMPIKITGIGIKGYFKDSFNIFDSIVVGVTIIDLVVTVVLTSKGLGEGVNTITALRSFRLMRVFKLS